MVLAALVMLLRVAVYVMSIVVCLVVPLATKEMVLVGLCNASLFLVG